jgi:hypothetical protein
MFPLTHHLNKVINHRIGIHSRSQDPRDQADKGRGTGCQEQIELLLWLLRWASCYSCLGCGFWVWLLWDLCNDRDSMKMGVGWVGRLGSRSPARFKQIMVELEVGFYMYVYA